MYDLDERVAFVAGGSSGINLEVACRLAEEGMKLAIFARDPAKLVVARQNVEQRGKECAVFAGDVRNAPDLEAAVAGAVDRFGRLDVVVAGAAGNFVCKAEAITANGFQTVLGIDTLGTFNTFKAAFPHLTRPGGVLVAISAPQATVAYPGQAHVSAAKAGVDMLLRSLAVEWGPLGIRAVGVSPGPIEDTEGMRRLAPKPTDRDRIAGALPLRRNGRRAEIAECVAFLVSDRASYITGTTIPCDGGLALMGPMSLGAST